MLASLVIGGGLRVEEIENSGAKSKAFRPAIFYFSRGKNKKRRVF